MKNNTVNTIHNTRRKTMSKKITFEDSLEASDWGLIIDKQGRLKGLFIPDGYTEDDIPESIIEMCVTQFDIDIDEFYGDDYPPVLH